MSNIIIFPLSNNTTSDGIKHNKCDIIDFPITAWDPRLDKFFVIFKKIFSSNGEAVRALLELKDSILYR